MNDDSDIVLTLVSPSSQPNANPSRTLSGMFGMIGLSCPGRVQRMMSSSSLSLSLGTASSADEGSCVLVCLASDEHHETPPISDGTHVAPPSLGESGGGSPLDNHRTILLSSRTLPPTSSPLSLFRLDKTPAEESTAPAVSNAHSADEAHGTVAAGERLQSQDLQMLDLFTSFVEQVPVDVQPQPGASLAVDAASGLRFPKTPPRKVGGYRALSAISPKGTFREICPLPSRHFICSIPRVATPLRVPHKMQEERPINKATVAAPVPDKGAARTTSPRAVPTRSPRLASPVMVGRVSASPFKSQNRFPTPQEVRPWA